MPKCWTRWHRSPLVPNSPAAFVEISEGCPPASHRPRVRLAMVVETWRTIVMISFTILRRIASANTLEEIANCARIVTIRGLRYRKLMQEWGNGGRPDDASSCEAPIGKGAGEPLADRAGRTLG
jgi:hypothetical protein